MYKAKDGRQFGSNDMGKSWDSHIASKPAAGMKPEMKPDMKGEGKESAQDVVAKHGPAEETRISKSGSNFAVHSRHKSGHMHKSEGHADLKSAHDESMALHGHNEENPLDDQMSEMNESPSLDNEAPMSV